jgi:hypothetical protein
MECSHKLISKHTRAVNAQRLPHAIERVSRKAMQRVCTAFLHGALDPLHIIFSGIGWLSALVNKCMRKACNRSYAVRWRTAARLRSASCLHVSPQLCCSTGSDQALIAQSIDESHSHISIIG